MLVCVKCGKELHCTQNGLGVRYNETHVYPGDKYTCSECGYEVIKTSPSAVHDPDKRIDTIEGKD